MRPARLDDAQVEPLLAGLTQEYETRYGESGEMTRASTDEFDPPSRAVHRRYGRADYGRRRRFPSLRRDNL